MKEYTKHILIIIRGITILMLMFAIMVTVFTFAFYGLIEMVR